MKSALKTALSLSLVAVLAACGGAGDTNTPTTTANKYEGTYSYCDGDHTRYKLTLTGTGNNNYEAISSEITYQNPDCTGPVLATYSEPIASTLSFIETATSPVSVPGLAPSLSIDKYMLNIPQQTATLTGDNVTQSGPDSWCFPVPPRPNICYGLNLVAEQVDRGFYMTNAGFYVLNLDSGTYRNDEGSLFVKE